MTSTHSVPICCNQASLQPSTASRWQTAHVGRDEAVWRSSRAVSHFLSAKSAGRALYATSSQSQTTAPDVAATSGPRSGFSVVEEFYDCVNRRDFDSVEELLTEGCVYEDLVFPKPFFGRQETVNFLKKFTAAVGPDLQFVIDDISKEDPVCVGVTWHLEWNGKPFPFSKGCSFYRLTRSGLHQQICYARDCVEPALKPGDSVLVIIRSVAALLRKFPRLANGF